MREQRLTLDQALRLLTTGGAYGVFAEEDLGMLAPGMLADLVVLSEDPHEVPKIELERIDVLMVFVGGALEVCAPAVETLCRPDRRTGGLTPNVEDRLIPVCSGAVLREALAGG